MNVCDCWGPDGHLDTKIDKFDLCHIYMSYASYIIICHIMTYDAYDIEIWHMSILSILVSKRPYNPQQSPRFIRFGLKTVKKWKNLKNTLEIFSLYKFWKSFVFSVEFSLALRVIKDTTKWNVSVLIYIYLNDIQPKNKYNLHSFVFWPTLMNHCGPLWSFRLHLLSSFLPTMSN